MDNWEKDEEMKWETEKTKSQRNCIVIQLMFRLSTSPKKKITREDIINRRAAKVKTESLVFFQKVLLLAT